MRSLWDEFVVSRAFWVNYVWPATDFTGSPSLIADMHRLLEGPHCGAVLVYHLPSHYSLRLQIDPGEHRIEILHETFEEPMLVGTMDCNQMSDLFRWDEYQAVIRQLGQQFAPTWAHELLLSFYVAVTADCVEQHSTLLRARLTDSGAFSGDEVEHIAAYTRRAALRQDFRWVADPERGWVAEGKNSYCMRHTRGGFNFSAFRDFMSAMQA